MSRWEPDARGRLEKAAFELFQERGYDHTTVEEIAARAGLTERTFFRYYADKREVLFSGSDAVKTFITDAIAAAPADVAPLEAVTRGLEAAGAGIEERRTRAEARVRQGLVTAHTELRERELNKMGTLAAAMTASLLARGVAELPAQLAAETGTSIFKVGFELWVGDTRARGRSLSQHIRAAHEELEAMITGSSARPASRAPTAPRTRASRRRPPKT